MMLLSVIIFKIHENLRETGLGISDWDTNDFDDSKLAGSRRF